MEAIAGQTAGPNGRYLYSFYLYYYLYLFNLLNKDLRTYIY